MRNLYYLIICFLSFSVLSAQEKLSKEEKARREKNIQAGNPFAKYGCKAPVATLSKGKYLEVHDLDSIVTIGTSRWDVDNKKIVGDIKIDSLNVDAQPIGDAPGMWMSPDPLSEEFPSWSPYTMCYDNPVKYKDPDGRAADDWRTADGKNKVYDEKTGEYTKYATADDKKFGEALKNSGAEGASQFSQLVNSDTKISITFNEGTDRDIDYHFGETTFGNNGDGVTYKANGDVDKVVTAHIDIFKGTSEQYVKDINNNTVNTDLLTDRQKSDASLIKNNNLTPDNVTTATLGHEISHTTKENRQVNVEERRGTHNADKERIPQRTNNNILTDISKKR